MVHKRDACATEDRRRACPAIGRNLRLTLWGVADRINRSSAGDLDPFVSQASHRSVPAAFLWEKLSMSGPIVRTGTTPSFWSNWDNVFGGKKGAAKKAPSQKAAPAKKAPAKKAAKPAKKKKG